MQRLVLRAWQQRRSSMASNKKAKARCRLAAPIQGNDRQSKIETTAGRIDDVEGLEHR
jgi:hypothetical protein